VDAVLATTFWKLLDYSLKKYPVWSLRRLQNVDRCLNRGIFDRIPVVAAALFPFHGIFDRIPAVAGDLFAIRSIILHWTDKA
jgi:hypothetical protein